MFMRFQLLMTMAAKVRSQAMGSKRGLFTLRSMTQALAAYSTNKVRARITAGLRITKGLNNDSGDHDTSP